MPKALFLVGGWPGHEPDQCAAIFVDFLRSRGWEVQIGHSLDVLLDSKLVAESALIVPIWTMGELSVEQSQALCHAVAQGTGLAGWHGGMGDAFRTDTNYQFMTGGQWVAHPGDIFTYTVNTCQDSAGFMAGLKAFQVESEQYYMHVDPGNEILATTIFNGEHGDTPWIRGTVMPVVWKRMYGKGRVFYSSLGHAASDFDVPEVKEIIKRGLQWAAGEPITIEFQSR